MKKCQSWVLILEFSKIQSAPNITPVILLVTLFINISMLPDHSVNLANASSLFDSPHLIFKLNLKPQQVKHNLFPQLERILKPEAAFIYSDY